MTLLERRAVQRDLVQGWFYDNNAPSRLLVATSNQGKLAEIATLLKPYVSEITSVSRFAAFEVEETGATYADNALLKARAAFEMSGWASVADDSGFEVDALDGQPGLFSARWAVQKNGVRDFAYAIERLRKEMQTRSCTESAARFACALALVRSDGAQRVFEGEVQGRVVFPPRGEYGFGYDPVFVPHRVQQHDESYRKKDCEKKTCENNRTFGEMKPEEKECISHRAHAFRLLCEACFVSRNCRKKSAQRR